MSAKNQSVPTMTASVTLQQTANPFAKKAKTGMIAQSMNPNPKMIKTDDSGTIKRFARMLIGVTI